MAGPPKRLQGSGTNDPDAISLVNAEGQVLYASAAAAKVLGYKPEELLGRNGFDLLHPQDRDRSLRSLKRIVAEPQSDAHMKARFRQKDGQWRWVESTASNLLNVPGVAAIIIVYREIRHPASDGEVAQRSSDELRLLNSELREFAHTIAHDFREPLRSIAACTELLLRRAELDSAGQQSARFIVDGVRTMSSLSENLLTSATRGFNENLRRVNLDSAAARALDNLREAIESSGAKVTVAPLPTVLGIESDLIRVFQNLIGNAVKYRGADPVEVQVATERSGPDVIIKVRDSGIGIPKEQHRNVFGLFRRLHAQVIPGTGIGLAVCKKVIEEMGGAIWVESEPGCGSTFCFTVAAARGDCAPIVTTSGAPLGAAAQR